MMIPLVVFLTAMADVEWLVSPSVADAGIPFDVQLRLQGEGRTGPDLDVPTPEVDGLVVLEGPDVRSGSNLSIVNGSASAAWTRSFSWSVVAESAGLYQLPELTIKGEDRDFKVKPRSVVVRGVEWVVSPSFPDAEIPFDVQLRLQGEGRTVPDFDVPTPEVDGLVVLEGPDVRSGSNIILVNGSASAAWTRSFSWSVVAESAGLYQLPELTIKGEDRDFKVKPRSVVVRELEPSQDVFVELRCSNLTPWVDQLVDLELTVLFRPFEDEELGIRIGGQDLSDGIDWDRSALGPFSGIVLSRARPRFVLGRGEQQGWEGFRWTVSERFRSPGSSVVEPVRLVGTYPVSLVRTNTVFGSRIRIARRSPVRVDTTPLQIQVRPPPQEGQPQDWVGAVGRFTLSTSLDRETLQVGEPVTLTLKVEDLDGNADLARLPDPPIESLLQDAGWQLSPDPAPGKVDGQVRTIRRSIRPTERAAELPSLRLPYFDPESLRVGRDGGGGHTGSSVGRQPVGH